MDEKIQLFSILQVSEKLKIPKHTLRFWEKELEGLVVPLRTSGGQRRYTFQHITILEEISRLRADGKGLSEIRSEISNGMKGRLEPKYEIERLAKRVAEIIRVEVSNFLEDHSSKNYVEKEI